MRNMKNLLSLFLAFIIIFSAFSPVFAASKINVKKLSAREELENQNNDLYSLNDEIDVIVELNTQYFSRLGENLSAENLRDRENIPKQIDFAKKANEKALYLINEAGISFNKMYDLEVITVGFTGSMTYGEALRLADQDFIKRVNISVTYEMPEREEINMEDLDHKRMMTSKFMVGNQGLYTQYDGAGGVVAVLDSGTDVDHEVFYLTESGKAKAKIKEEDLSKLSTPGTYFSDKIPFGFDYSSKRNTKNSLLDTNKNTIMHGQHVAATAVGNHTKVFLDGKEMDFSGIAPEAQLLAMRVFSNDLGGTKDSWYVPAMDDAVKLGADAINMSLGGPMGTQATVGVGVNEAIERASEIGSIVAIAAGNDGHAGQPHMPNASNPDYGVTQTPGIARMAMTVASIENTNVLKGDYDHGSKKYSGENNLYVYSSDGSQIIRKSFLKTPFTEGYIPEGEKLSYVDLGFANDPAKIPDMTGKIALVEMSDTSIYDILTILGDKNARGVIYFNDINKKEYVVTPKRSISGYKPWVGLLTRADGLFLKENLDAKISYSLNKDIYMDNPAYGRISDFSAWGVTADGDLKPDIMAPGGEIYSAINTSNPYGFKYQYMSGTSMATPHVAGGVALIKSRIKREFSNLSGTEQFYMLKNLIMSTASIHENIYTGVISSPRQQGAGLMNLDAAASTKAVLYNPIDNEAKINLGDLKDTIDLSFKIKNISNQSVTYKYKTILTTNEVDSRGKFTLNPVQLDTIEGSSITVAGGQEETINISFDVSKHHADLIKKMRNGYFLEGFVVFDSDTNEAQLSIPFMGFKGVYNELPVIEEFINELSKHGETPVYCEERMAIDNFTHMASTVSGQKVILGQEYDFDPKDPKFHENPKFHDPVISPNGDGKVDAFDYTVVFNRNTLIYKSRINKLDGENRTLVEEQMDRLGFMKHYKPRARNGVSFTNPKQKFGTSRPVDGKYELEFETLPVMLGANPVIQRQIFYVDTVKPKIVNVKLDGDILTFDGLDELTGILYKEAYIGSQKLEVNEKGQFIVPTGTQLSSITLKVADYGYNEISGPADTFKENTVIDVEEKTGSITINASVSPVGAELPNYSIKVKDSKDKEYTSLDNLPIGKYTIIIENIQDGYSLENENPTYVEISESNLDQIIELKFIKEPELKTQLINIGLLSKHSVKVTSSKNVGKVTIYRGDEVEISKLLVGDVEQGVIDLSKFDLKRNEKLTFVIKADGYKDVVATRTIRR